MLSLEKLGGRKSVKTCPVTRASVGVMTVEPGIIAQIAGATSSKDEWLMWLLGERSDDGYEVHVTGYHVPPQKRGGSHADLANQAEGHDMPANLVGVIHLHPWKGAANFSSIDHADLNPLYPSSIVVSPADNNLGFTYSAEGKVVLPCGSTGVIGFEVAVAGSERHMAEPVRGVHDPKYTGLGDCNQYTELVQDYALVDSSACGLEETQVRPAIYGSDGTAIMAAVEAATVVEVRYGGVATYQPGKALPAGYRGGYGANSSGRPAGISKKSWKRMVKQNGSKLSAFKGAVLATMSSNKGYRCDICLETVPKVSLVEGDLQLCDWCEGWNERYQRYQLAEETDAQAGIVEARLSDLVDSEVVEYPWAMVGAD